MPLADQLGEAFRTSLQHDPTLTMAGVIAVIYVLAVALALKY